MHFGFFHYGDADGFTWTGLHTRGCFSVRQALVTHVALAHNPALLGILRYFIGTHEDAVLASDALVVEVADNASKRILIVSEHRTAIETARFDAMMTCGGDSLLE